ncbi:putative ion transporter superfamily protein YfcC [Lewinella aquimaris]|uniref:Putative ion transporter superfamily protein YfcC n=1 Tax=Neolewinella aquimaris TaxID=1835722 RepID=A0A840E5E6_9BACT|nr:AbgT family transporter [Neolewinella aquimaris]MBB4080290.1 putative ion transporter superfamily protein YfcC [Neolewinella aquimaris]
MPQPRPWYASIPPPLVMLFVIIVAVTVMTYLLPAGLYERVEIDGRLRVVPDSYGEVPATPVGFFEMFRAFPEGYRLATPVIFICLASALMFSVLERTQTIENAVGRLVYRMGTQRAELLLILLTLVYGLLGVLVGYENNIATVPIAVVVVLALGGDLVLAAGVSLGGMTVAFGLSPINPYTVGIGHEIAGLPLFSGWWLRSVLCFGALGITAYYNVRYYRRLLANPESGIGRGLDTSGLALSRPLADYRISRRNWWLLAVFLSGLGVVLYGVFQWGFGINEISAVFLIVTVVCTLTSGLTARSFTDAAMRSVAEMAPATFIIGMAATVKVIMEQGQIQDTISYGLALALDGLPTYASAVGMSIGQSGINLLIPSGSGQALATLPVMIPLGRALDLSPQIAILAFQIGDGVTNLFNPSLGGLVAMLGICRVPFDRWLRFVLPLTGILLVWAWIGLLIAVAIGYS